MVGCTFRPEVDRVPWRGWREIAAFPDFDRVLEMLMKMGGVLNHPAVHRA